MTAYELFSLDRLSRLCAEAYAPATGARRSGAGRLDDHGLVGLKRSRHEQSGTIVAMLACLRLLARPGWAGWGTILTGASLIATVAVAVLLYRFSDQEQQARIHATRAELAPSVQLVREDTSGLWWLEVDIHNGGPATAASFRAEVVVGGQGIGVAAGPTTSTGSVSEGFTVGLIPTVGPACKVTQFIVRANEGLLPGDTVHIEVALDANPQVDQAIQKSDQLVTGGIWNNTHFRFGSFLPPAMSPSESTILPLFLHSISAAGTNVDFPNEWTATQEGLERDEGSWCLPNN